MEDRRVHVASDEFEVVRYERAGKWYIEPTDPGGKRQHVNIDQAVDFAYHLMHENSRVLLNVPGGALFEKRLRDRIKSGGT